MENSDEYRLLILDVDGLLIKRERCAEIKEIRKIDALHLEVPGFKIEIRKEAQAFLTELFQRSTKTKRVAIWTSSNFYNFEKYLPQVFPDNTYSRLLFKWDRSMCDLDPDYGSDPNLKEHDTIKPISRVFTNPVVNSHRKWNADNTLILDDSDRKLRLNPETTYRIVSWEQDLMSLISEIF